MPLLALWVGGCAPVVNSEDGSITTGFMGERRGGDEFVEDNWIALKIRGYFARSDKVSLANLNVSCFQGEVLLTGAAANQAEIDEAIRLAKNTTGVRKVHAELRIQSESAEELAKDAMLTSQIKLALMGDAQVRGLDIKVETTKGVVYLTGIAQSVNERDQAVWVAQSAEGVKKVVSYIRINPNSYKVMTHDNKSAPAP
ncbi:MAG: BON domain-containing protein [Magnetococcus sp. DMHC-6]